MLIYHQQQMHQTGRILPTITYNDFVNKWIEHDIVSRALLDSIVYFKDYVLYFIICLS